MRQIQEFRLVKGSTLNPLHLLKFQSNKSLEINALPQPITLARRIAPNLPSPIASEPLDITSHDVAHGSLPSTNLSEALTSNVVDIGGPTTSDQLQSPAPVGLDKDLIAPFGGAIGNKTRLFQKKTRDIHLIDDEIRKTKLEEAIPWVLVAGDPNIEIPSEMDVDTTDGDLEMSVFVGRRENQESEYMFFVHAEDGFTVVPAHYWYKFQEKPKLKSFTLEQVEELEKLQGKKGKKNNSWVAEHLSSGANAIGSGKNEDKSATKRSGGSFPLKLDTGGDFDELDFDVTELFADDDEDVVGDLAEEREGAEKELKKQFASGISGASPDNEGDEDDDEILGDLDKSSGAKRNKKNVLSDQGKAMRRILGTVDDDIYNSDESDYDEGEEHAIPIEGGAPIPTSVADTFSGAQLPRTKKRASEEEEEHVNPYLKRSKTDSPSEYKTVPPARSLEDEIIHLIHTQSLTTEQLIHSVGKARLQGENRSIFVETVKRVAKKNKDNKLVLKEST
jgi:transcription initiation factor TFIIF subunit alpha